MLRDNSMVHERFLQVKDLYKFVPFFLQKAEFIVSRSKSRKVDLLCQLMDGMEACCNILPVLLLLCLSRKSHLGLSELPQLLAEEAEGKKACLFYFQAVCVLETFLLLVLSVKMYILLVMLQHRPNPRAC